MLALDWRFYSFSELVISFTVHFILLKLVPGKFILCC
jgi:hypothetical protein